MVVVPAARVGEESSGGRGEGFGAGSKEDLDTGDEGDNGRGAANEFMQTFITLIDAVAFHGHSHDVKVHWFFLPSGSPL